MSLSDVAMRQEVVFRAYLLRRVPEVHDVHGDLLQDGVIGHLSVSAGGPFLTLDKGGREYPVTEAAR